MSPHGLREPSSCLSALPKTCSRPRPWFRNRIGALVPDPNTSEVVTLQNVQPSQAVSLLKALYPNLKVEALGDLNRAGGTIGLAGPRSLINQAKQSLTTADTATGSQAPDHVFRIYNIKYSSARVLRVFLQRAAPTIAVLTGPENYSPPRPSFRPITGATLGTATTGVGGSSSGSSSSGTTFGDVADIGPNSGLNSGANDPGGATTGNTSTTAQRGEVNDRAKTLILSGTSKEVDGVVTLLNQVDVAPRQVTVDVKVVNVSPQFNESIGNQFGFATVAVSNLPPGAGVDPTTGAQTTPCNHPLQQCYVQPSAGRVRGADQRGRVTHP